MYKMILRILLLSLLIVPVLGAQIVPNHITVDSVTYRTPNDTTLGIAVTFGVTDVGLDSLYLSGPWNHPDVTVSLNILLPPFAVVPNAQIFILWYDVAAVIEGQTVNGIINSRTYRNGCRSGTITCGGQSTGPLSIPFTWTRPSSTIPPPLPPYSNVANVEQILDSLRIQILVTTPWDGISVPDSLQVAHTTNELALIQFATDTANAMVTFMIPAPPTGVQYTGSYTSTAFRGCATTVNCTSTATSPLWRFVGQGPQPPEDVATWTNPEPPILYDQPLNIDIAPASVFDCSSIGMQFLTRPAGTIGVVDTMRIHIRAPGATGCTYFAPRSSATTALFVRTYFEDYMVQDTVFIQIPTAPSIIRTDTLSAP